MADPTGATAANLYVPGFKDNLNLLPQQKNARIAMCVDAEFDAPTGGTMFNADDMGTSDPKDVETRVPDSPEGFVDAQRRVGFYKPFHDGKFVDDEDKARMLSDPTDKTMQAMMAGLNRKRDDCVIAAAFGTYRYGPNGENTGGALSNIIAANDKSKVHQNETVPADTSPFGLTIGKLINVSGKLMAAEFDEDQGEIKKYFACTSNQISDLLTTIPATSQYYNQAQALGAGMVDNLLGFTFVRTERMPKTGTTRKCLAWVKPALVYKARKIINTQVTRRADKSFRWYAYYESDHGAVRRYDAGVWEVDCYEP